MDYYIEQTWKTNANYCASYKNSLKKKEINLGLNTTNVQVTQEYFDLFWMPDTFITNAKSMAMQSQVLNTQSLNIEIEKDKTIGSDICIMKYWARQDYIPNFLNNFVFC